MDLLYFSQYDGMMSDLLSDVGKANARNTYHGMGWFMTDPLVLMISADDTIYIVQ